jgi:hypothetical protein
MPTATVPTSAVVSTTVTRVATSIVTEREFRDSPFGQQASSTEARVVDVLVAAEGIIKRRINSPIIAADYYEVFPSVKSGRIFLKYRPVTEIYGVRYTRPYAAWADLIPSYFSYTPNSVIINPEYRSVVGYDIEVFYRAGYEREDVPADLKYAIHAQAALLLAQDFELYGAGDSRSPGFQYLQERIDEIVRLHTVGGLWYV